MGGDRIGDLFEYKMLKVQTEEDIIDLLLCE